MSSFGKILKFKSYDATRLERMRSDLGFQAPLALWQYCANYYSTRAKRDPYIEELKTLDRLFVALQDLPSLISVQELYTNDGALAETYQDMMQKRKELLGGVNTQIFLGDLLSLANAYLLRAGSKPSPSFPIAFWEDPVTLGMIPSPSNEKKSDDLFLLLLPVPTVEPPAEVPEEEFEAVALEENPPEEPQAPDLCGLMEDPRFRSEVKDLQKICHGGILITLLQEHEAFKIDLDALCAQDAAGFSGFLTHTFAGESLIRISAHSEEAFSALAKEYGYTAKPVASLDAGGSLTVLFEKKELFKLETAFLKTLFPQKLLRAKTKDEKAGALAPISFSAFSAPKGFFGVQASCAPTGAFFTNALFTALDAVILQSLNGTPYWEQRLWITLQIPKDPDDHTGGDLLSSVIGLYRLQAELGISASTRAVYAEHVSTPVLTVVACGKSDEPIHPSRSLSDTLGEIQIPTAENGLPKFDELREFLGVLAQKKTDEPSKASQFIETEPEKEDAV